MVQTTADAGSISVPMSSILDALESVLTEDERNALFEQLIGLRPSGVAPGDLITAELFNQVLSDINGLSIRLAALEGASGGPVIERIEPEGVNKSVGSLLTIIGNNFRPDESDTFVSFGAIDIKNFDLASDEHTMLLPVPVGLSQLPATVPVSITCRGKKSNTINITVVEQVVVPGGNLNIQYHGGGLGEIEIGKTYDLIWRLHSQLNVPRSFTVEPVVTGVVGSDADAWIAGVKLPAAPITLQPGAFQDVTMKVTVPDDAQSASINLHAESTTDSINSLAQSPFKLEVGAETAVSDLRATIATMAVNATEIRRGSIDVEGQTLLGFKIQPGQSVDLPMQIGTTAANTPVGAGGGFYLFKAEMEDGPQKSRWTPGPTPAARLQLGSPETHAFSLAMASSALVDLTTVSWLKVTAECYATNVSPTPKFTSFSRVPIIGKAVL
jgi:hypothetical protein